MRKRQVRITEALIQKAIIATANRLMNEGQGWEMAKAGIRNAFGGGKYKHDQYPLPADRFDTKWGQYDKNIADSNLGMKYYDEEGRPTNDSSRVVPCENGAFEIEDNKRADNSWFGRLGRRAGMAVHDGAMKLGAKVRDFYDEGSGMQKEGIDRHERALNEAIRRNRMQNRIVESEIRKSLRR